MKRAEKIRGTFERLARVVANAPDTAPGVVTLRPFAVAALMCTDEEIDAKFTDREVAQLEKHLRTIENNLDAAHHAAQKRAN